MRRSDPSAPFDHDAEPESDLTQEFWGRSAGWQSGDDRTTRRARRIDDTGSLQALRDGVAAFRPQRIGSSDPSGQVRRVRTHGAVQPVEPTVSDRRATATIGDLAAGTFDEDVEARPDFDLPLTPVTPTTGRLGLGAVDPLLVRLGILVLVGVLLVPFALALRGSSDAPDTVEIDTQRELSVEPVGAMPAADPTSSTGDGAPTAELASPQSVATSSATPATSATVDANATSSAPGSTVTAASATAATTTDEQPVGDVPQSIGAGIDEAATVDAAAERVVPECPQTYRAAAGDSWYRIADAAGVTPSALMAENRATVDKVILPGDDICLPSGATMPSPPTTDAPATTSPSTTSPKTTSPSTTSPKPTAPSGSPGRDATVDEIKNLIRTAFPESEWETAFTIVQRESKFDPTAYNGWCCYGLFQIYWGVHRSWLDEIGVYSTDDLLDPLLNVRAAHAIWQRSGNSWSAWSTYDG